MGHFHRASSSKLCCVEGGWKERRLSLAVLFVPCQPRLWSRAPLGVMTPWCFLRSRVLCDILLWLKKGSQPCCSHPVFLSLFWGRNFTPIQCYRLTQNKTLSQHGSFTIQFYFFPPKSEELSMDVSCRATTKMHLIGALPSSDHLLLQ